MAIDTNLARYTGPKEKKERRAGEKLFIKGERSFSPKAAIIKKPYPPGMHGPRARRRMSEYGTQLAAKQKIRHTYKVLERQFRRYAYIALATRAQSQKSLAGQLERRLDSAVYRCGFADARDGARQLVSHGHILVNNHRITIPSYQLNVGDNISVSGHSMQNKYFQTILPLKIKNYNPPHWIELDKEKLQASIIDMPNIEDSGLDSKDLQTIIEFYSR